MVYRLVCLTHGDSETLKPTLDSFWEHVSPRPESVIIAQDGPGNPYIPDWYALGVAGELWRGQVGFCQATQNLWKLAIDGKPGTFHKWALHPMGDMSFVFWLEHDFIFQRDVDLTQLAAALNVNQRVAQMLLVRGAVNPDEHAAGGVIERYKAAGSEFLARNTYGHKWLEHDAYFSTNPSLMRVGFMRMNPWLSTPKECEGRYGIELKSRGYTFGMWGKGESWVKHIGERTGWGY